jgi:hypothetical protein
MGAKITNLARYHSNRFRRIDNNFPILMRRWVTPTTKFSRGCGNGKSAKVGSRRTGERPVLNMLFLMRASILTTCEG